MKEHIIFDKIEMYKSEVEKKPLSLLTNILFLTYLSLGKQYEELLTHTEQFLMSSMYTSTLAEDFNLLGNLALRKTDTAKTILINIKSLDPEDSHIRLLMSTIKQEEYLELAYIFSPQTERKKISEILKKAPKISQSYEFYRIPDVIGIKDHLSDKIKIAIEKDPTNPTLKVSLAEALLKLGQIDEAEKELNNILLIYPNYPRALYLYAKIKSDYRGEERESISYLKKIFNLNPISQYLRGAEVMFLNEKEDILENELREVFQTNNPFIGFFKENFKQTPKKDIEKKEKELPIKKTEELPKIERTDSPLEKGFDSLDKKKYTDAIEQFLKELEKK